MFRKQMRQTDGSAVFRPVIPNQAVATLLLIENSQSMMTIWPHLRDHYLPTLIGTLRIANPVAPIKILVLTSAPVDDSISTTEGPREYYELPDVLFDLRPDNKISAATIRHSIELLATAGFGESTARHIIIVASSAPADVPISTHVVGHDHDFSPSGSEWHALAQRLTQKDIQCHMILCNPDLQAFSHLFYETLHLQQFEEVVPWFPFGGNFLFLLSARPIRNELVYGGVQVPCNNTAEQPLLYRDLFPPDVHSITNAGEPSSAAAGSPEAQTDMSTPTLVACLQQAHGLTKKKIYGTKPTRQPFFREDRVREKYRHAPTPLTIPLSMPDTATGSLVHRDGPTSRAKLDRGLLGEKGTPVSPTDRHSRSKRQSSWSQRGSRVSSPETDASLSSPTSMSTYGAVSPMSPDFDQFTSSLPLPPAATTSVDDSYQEAKMGSVGMSAARLMDPVSPLTGLAWQQGHYFAGATSLVPSSHPPVSSAFVNNVTSQDGTTTPKIHPLPRRHSASYQPVANTLPFLRTSSPSGSGRPITGLNEPTYLSLRNTYVDGNAPFIFDDEYDTAPAQDVRPSPNVHYSTPSSSDKVFIQPAAQPPRQNPCPPSIQPYMPSSTAAANPGYYRTIYSRPDETTHNDSKKSKNTSVSTTNAGSSSLTGWAG